MNMYVANLGYQVQEEDLKNLFSPFGEVISASIIKDRVTGESRGFGFVEMQSAEAAGNAIAGLNNTELKGRNVTVSIARERGDRPGVR